MYHLTKIIDTGVTKAYQFDMLYRLDDEYTYEGDYAKFEKFVEEWKDKYLDDFTGLMFRYFRGKFRFGLLLYFLKYVSDALFPIFIKQFISWVQDEEADINKGLFWSGMLGINLFLSVQTSLWGYYYMENCTIVIKTSLRGLIINKISHISPGAKKYVDIAKVTNFLMNDLSKLTMLCLTLGNIYFTPPLFIAFIIIAAFDLKFAVLIIPVLIIVSLFLQTLIMKKFKQLFVKKMRLSDQRGKKINEVISGIKIIKFNAWEKIMSLMIQKIRVNEASYLRFIFLMRGLADAAVTSLPLLCGLGSFILYDFIYPNDPLTIPQIISLINIFQMMISPIMFFMMGLMNLAESKAASARLGMILKVDKLEPLKNSEDLALGSLEVSKGDFVWEDPKYYKIFNMKKDDLPTASNKILENINLKIIPGEMLMVVGRVGSGKSSLIQALLNEMIKTNGEIKKNGKFAYVPQEAFLSNDTIKNNICFGMPYDEAKFNDVIKICELTSDLEILPGKEETEIGERGINLSGGQKQRISIARAVYAESDIYLIDDALSALDAHVGKNIMNNVFISRLKGKTIVLTTHYLNLLEKADRVCLLDKGKIQFLGKYKDIQDTDEFKKFSQAEKKLLEEENVVVVEENKESLPKKSLSNKLPPISSANKDDKQREVVTPTLPKDGKDLTKDEKKERGVLTQKEKRFEGQVRAKIYVYYIRSAGVIKVAVYMLLLAFSTLATIGTNWWVTRWANDAFDLSKATYMIVYALLGALVVFLLLLVSVMLGTVASRASLTIFSSIVSNILKRPMSFFDTTPSGTIINRCTADIEEVDTRVPFLYQFFLSALFNVVIVLILTAIVTPIVLVIFVLVLIVVIYSFGRFVQTTTEVKRLVQLATSPMISVGSEFISGITVIRGFAQNEGMVDKYKERVGKLHAADYHEQMAGLWMRSRLEYAFKIIIGLTIVLIVINKEVIQIFTTSDSGEIGLILSYLLMISGIASALLYTSSNLAKIASSIERLHEYAFWEEHEADFDKPQPAVQNWPTTGSINFKNLSIRYRKGLPLVLDKVNFSIESGEKYAIVGRTGSGKSTLLLALYRILEMAEDETNNPIGEINIDGVNISDIGLHHLRRGLAIIPQDPFLLQGTMRFNIDPLDKHTDEEVMEILSKVGVLDTIKIEDIIDQRSENNKAVQSTKKVSEKGKDKSNPEFKSPNTEQNTKVEVEQWILDLKKNGPSPKDILEYKIEANGSNLSVGQRQLLCIGRAIVGKPKILLMDEATANIDQRTDSVIQTIIKKELVNTTVITIAHRLITIIQYDKLVVLENGKKVEEGSPSELIRSGGYFCKLVEEGGSTFKDNMLKAAGDHSLDPAAIFS